MKPIQIMIVDDSKPMREDLIDILKKYPGFEVAASVSSGAEALKTLEKGGIDALFLDVEMPEMSGLEVAQTLSTWSKPPVIVFATVYQHYALAGFENNAIDYILKPYQEDRIVKTLKKIQASVPGNHTLETRESSLEKGTKKITLRQKNSKDRIVVDLADIDYFHADLASVSAHTETQDYVVMETLKQLHQNFASYGFELAHRAYLVNLSKIKKIAPLFNGAYEITLKSGVKMPVSRAYAKIIRKKIGDI